MKVGSKGKVIAIEPEPVNLKYLAINTKELGNVDIIDYAVWESKGIMSLNTFSSPAGHSLIWGDKDSVKVKTDTLDNLTKKYPKIDYIKIDVQGAEINVLSKAKDLFNRCGKWVIETHYRNDKDKATYPKVMELMRNAGFKVYLHQGYVVYGIKSEVCQKR